VDSQRSAMRVFRGGPEAVRAAVVGDCRAQGCSRSVESSGRCWLRSSQTCLALPHSELATSATPATPATGQPLTVDVNTAPLPHPHPALTIQPLLAPNSTAPHIEPLLSCGRACVHALCTRHPAPCTLTLHAAPSPCRSPVDLTLLPS
jgi:hypothetical protein